MTTSRLVAALLLTVLAAPIGAYIPPATTVLREAAKRRAGAPASVEARGALQLGDASPIPATLWLKSPGRCRLELALPGATPAERPVAVVRSGKLASARSMESAPAAVALLEAACTVLALPGGEGSDRAHAHALAQRGVTVASVTFGHLGPTIAYVLGGPARSDGPQAWIEKQYLQPLRLVADLAGARRDVRFLEWIELPAAFPKMIEVHDDDVVEARFAVERVVPNPRVPDSMF